MKVLLFGGTGWVGHNIALNLQQHGYEVTICSRGRKNTFATAVQGIPSVQGDKSNADDMRRILAQQYEVIIDSVPTLASIELVATLAKGLRHYIHCSSTGGYAPLPFLPCDETAPYGGFCGTSGWKAKADYDADALGRFCNGGFPATVIRPCYITGPGMLPLDNLGGRRQDFIADLQAEKTLDLPDNGLSLLQPIHVLDLANSFRLALENRRSVGQIYNICLAHAVTLNKYLELNAAALGKQARISYLPLPEMLQRYPEAHAIGMRFLATHMCFSIEKAVRDMGYRPHCTPEEAIAETARWAAQL
ncbi:MAG: NAD-dependent epimerase/dehydratase family protein [Oligosphaeraceae bacterium]|nr:NAD-dependent epimerase/dehydratase family protein [Oligosphaeraceae bacterium]